MHRALEIQDILLNIFDCLCCRKQLAYLARTCHAFREPALDILWKELHNLSPLVRCLPKALSPNIKHYFQYSFSRRLTQIDWDILQSYTRRIRSITDFENFGIDKKSVKILSCPPTTELLFPNVCHMMLRYEGSGSTPYLLRLAFPSLISLDVKLGNPRLLPPWFQDSLASLPDSSPNVEHLSFHDFNFAFGEMVSSWICRWRNLHTVDCPNTSLDMDALTHLSRMPALTQLAFRQIITLPNCTSPLLFSNLSTLELHPTFFSLIPQLLSRLLLPAIKNLDLTIDSCPSRQELSSFFAAVRTSNADYTIERLSLRESSSSGGIFDEESPLLSLADLRPCTAFINLHRIHIDIGWDVGLTDNDLLALALSWPNLENLAINEDWGWNTVDDGITPNGLLQILQTCPSLSLVAIAMDTRGYTELPPATLGFTLPSHFSIDVLDSVIEEESVPAVAAFFTAMNPSPDVSFNAWSGIDMIKPPDWEVYKDRWHEVCRLSNMTLVFLD
ncbi:hypothetical protein EV363DRAFT_1176649 [Boletus edulis]|nr:hypothetical protein EV363DRAFT_1176649 [Boletus edulis]